MVSICFQPVTKSVACLLCCLLLVTSLDIDECAEGTDRCAQNCHNTIGRHTCSCDAGFRLNANGYDCDGKNSI